MLPFLHFDHAGSASAGWFALGGVLVGGLATFLGQYLLQRSDRRSGAQQVARALAGEMAGLVSMAERRRYVSVLRKLAEVEGPILHISMQATRNYFKVFDANADKLGLLGGDLPEHVAAFYVRASGILEDFEAISAPWFATYSQADQRKYFTETAGLLEETLDLAKKVIPRLRDFADAKALPPPANG